jgi:hypothetical protein
MTLGQKMFEILTHRKPKISTGTRLVGGPSRNEKGTWPVWYVAEVSGVRTFQIGDVLAWLHGTGMLATMAVQDVVHLNTFITDRVAAGGTDVHVVLFDRVHDLRDLNIDLNAGEHPASLPHPRTSSLLAYLLPALYWHNTIEAWLGLLLQREIQRLIRV